MWHLTPVVRIRFQDQLDTRLMAHDAIRPQTDRLFLELVTTDFLGVVLRYNPPRASGGCGIVGQEIRPGFVQPEAHMVRVDYLNGLDPLFQVPPHPLCSAQSCSARPQR